MVNLVLNILFLPLTLLNKLLFPTYCSKCKSRWSTELLGDWGKEDWYCHTYDYYW